jgi:hypothetical protein
MVWSPDQGPDMVVALYQQGSQLFVDWGNTFPFTYDKFIVRVDGAQFDSSLASGDKMDGGNNSVVPSLVVPQPPTVNTVYTVILEGCDTALGGSTCHQSWTIPVTYTYRPPGTPPPPSNEFTLDFSNLTPASAPTDAQTQLLDRALAVARDLGCTSTLGDVFKNEEPFMEGAIAKLFLVSNSTEFCDNPPRPLPLRSEVNSALRFQQIKSKSGTTSDFPLCPRTGEYDQALTGYITLLDRFGSLLHNDVRNHIVNFLLNERGPVDTSEFSYCSGNPETENHLNMIESARYLTNQILYEAGGNPLYDNEANGMNNYMLGRLQSFLRHDFLEYNSKPYQNFTSNALQNLFDFAKDRRVKMGAKLVLDYVSAKYAVSSNSLRRNAPYRRRVSDYTTMLLDKAADTQNSRFTLLSGMFGINGEIAPNKFLLSWGYRGPMITLAASTYRAPEAILDLLMNSAHRNFYQRIHHDGVEIYSSRPDYLITGGGYWMGSPYTFAGASLCDDDGLAVPTTLMPTGFFIDSNEMIRIDGIRGDKCHSGDALDDARDRSNTCVTPDFACGINPIVPDRYKQNVLCFHAEGPWNFVDVSSPGCNDRSFGFYAAVFIGSLSGSDTFGFFEAHPRDPNLSFDAFWRGVLARNGQRTFNTSGTNSYVMTSGVTVRFSTPVPAITKFDWAVVTGDPRLDQLGTDISQWPLASGDILNSVGNSGIVTFDNPGMGGRLVLDFSDLGEPKRTEQ